MFPTAALLPGCLLWGQLLRKALLLTLPGSAPQPCLLPAGPREPVALPVEGPRSQGISWAGGFAPCRVRGSPWPASQLGAGFGLPDVCPAWPCQRSSGVSNDSCQVGLPHTALEQLCWCHCEYAAPTSPDCAWCNSVCTLPLSTTLAPGHPRAIKTELSLQ